MLTNQPYLGISPGQLFSTCELPILRACKPLPRGVWHRRKPACWKEVWIHSTGRLLLPETDLGIQPSKTWEKYWYRSTDKTELPSQYRHYLVWTKPCLTQGIAHMSRSSNSKRNILTSILGYCFALVLHQHLGIYFQLVSIFRLDYCDRFAPGRLFYVPL